MIIFNEGLPRSGKSYDAVLTHILPAIKAGRRVYARLDGLDVPKIAAHLKMPVDRVGELLTLVEESDVRKLPATASNDSLIVIDEAHKYYVASRDAIDPVQETFFAEHGHKGQDILIISQWYRRLHSAVRARIERKQLFQKLTAVGAKNSYKVRYYHAIGPERFEQTGGATKKYDPVVFPLYHGFTEETGNVAVYEAGGQTVWKKLRVYAVVVLPLVALGVYGFWHFLHGGAVGVEKPPVQTTRLGAAPAVVQQQAAPVASAASPNAQHAAAIDTKGMAPELAYLFDLSAQARPRLAAIATAGGKSWGVIEWREDQGHVLERMNLDQVRALGLTAEVHPYGVKLVYRDKSIIVTSWPLDMPGTDAAANQSAQQGQQQPSQAVAASGQGQGSGPATEWRRKPVSSSYVPPEILPHPTQSDWKG